MDCEHILVVEDDMFIRETIKDVLELEGYRVATAGNGAEGLDQLERLGPPCLVFLDLMMPVMDGWQFLETLKQNKGNVLSMIPVTVVSAAVDVADVGQRYNCEIIKKPPDLDQLVETARRYCSACAARDPARP